jgi:hypothetical protein
MDSVFAMVKEHQTEGDVMTASTTIGGGRAVFRLYFRGAPHVHVWVNIADDPSVPLNARAGGPAVGFFGPGAGVRPQNRPATSIPQLQRQRERQNNPGRP